MVQSKDVDAVVFDVISFNGKGDLIATSDIQVWFVFLSQSEEQARCNPPTPAFELTAQMAYGCGPLQAEDPTLYAFFSPPHTVEVNLH